MHSVPADLLIRGDKSVTRVTPSAACSWRSAAISKATRGICAHPEATPGGLTVSAVSILKLSVSILKLSAAAILKLSAVAILKPSIDDADAVVYKYLLVDCVASAMAETAAPTTDQMDALLS